MTNSDSTCRRDEFSCTGSSAILSVIGRCFSSVVLHMIILLQGIFLPLPATAKTPKLVITRLVFSSAEFSSPFLLMETRPSLPSLPSTPIPTLPSAHTSNSLPRGRISCCHLKASFLAKARLLLAVLRFPSLRSLPCICYRHTESSNTSLSPAPISHESRPLMNRWTTQNPPAQSCRRPYSIGKDDTKKALCQSLSE